MSLKMKWRRKMRLSWRMNKRIIIKKLFVSLTLLVFCELLLVLLLSIDPRVIDRNKVTIRFASLSRLYRVSIASAESIRGIDSIRVSIASASLSRPPLYRVRVSIVSNSRSDPIRSASASLLRIDSIKNWSDVVFSIDVVEIVLIIQNIDQSIQNTRVFC